MGENQKPQRKISMNEMAKIDYHDVHETQICEIS